MEYVCYMKTLPCSTQYRTLDSGRLIPENRTERWRKSKPNIEWL